MRRAVFESFLSLRERGGQGALLTELDGAREAVIECPKTGETRRIIGDLDLTPALCEGVEEALRIDRGVMVGDVFITPIGPAWRLAIIGAVHIAQVLAPMAQLAGYQVVIIDPRQTFASQTRHPDQDLWHCWPQEGLQRFAPDSRSAIVSLSHDPKLDDPALAFALMSESFYIAALGSRRTHAARLARLAEQGFTATQCARLCGPAGLAIGAQSPAEIALSILAQLTQARHASRA
ncbi:MAG: XdhC family protein [Pseudomonadota bacterium]